MVARTASAASPVSAKSRPRAAVRVGDDWWFANVHASTGRGARTHGDIALARATATRWAGDAPLDPKAARVLLESKRVRSDQQLSAREIEVDVGAVLGRIAGEISRP